MALKPIPTTAAVIHGDHHQVAAALLAAAGALRGDGDDVPVPGPFPSGPHRDIHRPHGPLPPLLPHPPCSPRCTQELPAPHLTPSCGTLHHCPASAGRLPSGPLPLLSAKSRSLHDTPPPAPPACGAAESPLWFPVGRRLSTFAVSAVGSSQGQEAGSSSDSENVGRVCAAIADVIAAGADANLEATLSALWPPLSEALVFAVLNRFKHAHKPSYRFFQWAAASGRFTHTTVTYCKMVHILGKARQFESMVALVQEMGRAGALSMDAFKIAIQSYAGAGEIKNAVGVFEMMRKHGFDDGVESFNCLLFALAQDGLGREVRQMFDKMHDRYIPNLRSYTALLLAWCNAKNLVEAGRVWNEMLEKGMKPDVVVHNTMIEGLLRGQRQPEALKMFELMKAKGPQPNVRTYTLLIQDHCKRGKMDMTMRCFEDMLKAGLLPDVATYTCLLVGYGNAKRMDKVTAVLKEMTQNGCPPDGRTYNALIKLLTNRKMPDDAASIYKKMIKKGLEPTIHTYNMMMKSYFHGGKNYAMGFEVWEEMHRKGICPDVNSYTVFINGHIRHGKPEEACKYIEEMIDKGMKAPHVDYNKFVADFCKAGKPDILYELAQKVNFSGKFDASNVFYQWAERMKSQVKRTIPYQTGNKTF